MSLNLTLLFLCILGYVLLLNEIARIPYAVGPAITIGAITCVLFAADFAGGMSVAVYLLYAIGILAFVYCMYVRSRIGISSNTWELVLYTSIIALLYFLLYILNSVGAFREWDEFSHWGTIIKAVYGANTFHFRSNTLYFQEYPPGTALVSYFVLKLVGYSEGNAYFSHSLLVLAFLMPVVGLAKRPVSILISGALVFLLVFKLGNGFSSVLIDPILGVMFGGILSSYFLLRRDGAPLWPLSFMLAVLVLAKHSGQQLAVLISVCIIVDLIAAAVVNEQQPFLRCPSRQDMRLLAQTGLAIATALIVVGLMWSYHVSSSGARTGIGSIGLPGLIMKSLSCCTNERDAEIVRKFFHHIAGVWQFTSALPLADHVSSIDKSRFIARAIDASLAYSPLFMFFLLITFGCALVRIANTQKARAQIFLLTFILSFGAIAYSFAQLLFYLYVLSDYEARMLSSFDRYQYTYYLGWMLAMIGVGGSLLPETQSAVRAIVFAAVIAAIPGLWEERAGTAIVDFLRVGAPQIRDAREPVKLWASGVARKMPSAASVFVVWQGSNGEHFWYIHHELQPRRTNFDCYSLGPPKYDKDIWSCNLNEKELRVLLAKYQFLAIGQGLSDLKSAYPGLFGSISNPKESGLFQIEVSSNNRVAFKELSY